MWKVDEAGGAGQRNLLPNFRLQISLEENVDNTAIYFVK